MQLHQLTAIFVICIIICIYFLQVVIFLELLPHSKSHVFRFQHVLRKTKFSGLIFLYSTKLNQKVNFIKCVELIKVLILQQEPFYFDDICLHLEIFDIYFSKTHDHRILEQLSKKMIVRIRWPQQQYYRFRQLKIFDDQFNFQI